MEGGKMHRLTDLIEDIKKVDELLLLHSANPSDFMLEQYKMKKEKLISYLIDELIEPDLRSPRSFSVIQAAITRFYPNLKREAAADKGHEDLGTLEAILA